MATGLTAGQLRSSSPEELSNKLESHGRLHAVRKEIARIYTVMRERELGIITDVEDEAPADVAASTEGSADQ
jgi:large subunit ribosomal protein L29